MSNPIYTNFPAETWGTDPLLELALDLRWSWNHSTDQLWDRLEPELWQLTQNPWVASRRRSALRIRGSSSSTATTGGVWLITPQTSSQSAVRRHSTLVN